MTGDIPAADSFIDGPLAAAPPGTTIADLAQTLLTPAPDELRARLRRLREGLTPAIVWAATTTADCLGESDHDPDFPDVDWCLYDAGEDDPPLASGMMRQHAIALAELINSCPEIDAALARLTDLARHETHGDQP